MIQVACFVAVMSCINDFEHSLIVLSDGEEVATTFIYDLPHICNCLRNYFSNILDDVGQLGNIPADKQSKPIDLGRGDVYVIDWMGV